MEKPYYNLFKRQTYLLPEEAYEELKSIQSMLMGLARLTYNEQSEANSNDMLMLSRAELHCLFQEVSALIGGALKQAACERQTVDEVWMWQ